MAGPIPLPVALPSSTPTLAQTPFGAIASDAAPGLYAANTRSATSHVADEAGGTSPLAAKTARAFIYDSGTGFWYRCA